MTRKEGNNTAEVSWVCDVPLNEAHPDIRVDFLEYHEYRADGKRVKHFTWITDLHVTLRNAWLFVRGGRARWRIENETFNTLKNQGYHFEHNFGHGQRNLSVVFAMLMMLAFLVDQVQQRCCPLFQAVWGKLGSKRALWKHVRSLFCHFRIHSWRQQRLQTSTRCRSTLTSFSQLPRGAAPVIRPSVAGGENPYNQRSRREFLGTKPAGLGWHGQHDRLSASDNPPPFSFQPPG